MKPLRILRSPLAFLLLLLALVPMPAHAASGDAIFRRPGITYLALGDSLAFGYQLIKFNTQLQTTGTVNPAVFNTGYVDDFARLLSIVHPGIQTVNLGCPGETSSSFLSGGCPYTAPPHGFALHTSYSGSQMAAAVAFLHTHPLVSPITLDIGPNDVLQLIQSCGGPANTACIGNGLPAVIATLSSNLNIILSMLQQAAPHAEIIVMESYNPFATNPIAANNLATNTLTVAVNNAVAAVAMAHNVRLADAFTPFNLTQPQPQILCALTFFCTPSMDIHPTDAGYLVIARQFWLASSYS